MHIDGIRPQHLSSGDNSYSTAQAIGYAMDNLSGNAGDIQQYLQIAIQGNGTPQETYPPMQNFLASVVGCMDVLEPFLSAVFPNSSQISKDIATVTTSLSTLSQLIQNNAMPLSSAMNEVNTLVADVNNLSNDVASQAAKTPVSLSTLTTAFETANTYTVHGLNNLLSQSSNDIDPYTASNLLGMASIMSQLQICIPSPPVDYVNIQSCLNNITTDLANSPVNTADIANEMAAIRSAIGA